MRCHCPLILLIALVGCAQTQTHHVRREYGVRASVPVVSDPIRQDHPRLLITREDIVRVRALIKSDPAAASYFRGIQTYAEGTLNQLPGSWAGSSHIEV